MNYAMDYQLILDKSFWDIIGKSIHITSLEFIHSLKLGSRSTGLVISHDVDKLREDLSKSEFGEGSIIYINDSIQMSNATGLKEGSSGYDFVYFRNYLSTTSESLMLIERALALLKDGGDIIVEEMNFSKIYCTSSNQQYDKCIRTLEVYCEMCNLDFAIGEKLHTILKKYGCEKINSQFQPPKFISGSSRMILSKLLKSIKNHILELKILTEVEFENIIKELRVLENSNNNMISLPGIYQVNAKYYK